MCPKHVCIMWDAHMNIKSFLGKSWDKSWGWTQLCLRQAYNWGAVTDEAEAQALAFHILWYAMCFSHLHHNLSWLVTSSHHVQYISQAQNERWSEKFWNTWHRETERLIAALRLSVAQSGSWKSSAPGEASAELLLWRTTAHHLDILSSAISLPPAIPVQKWTGVGMVWDGGWMPTSPALRP